MANITITLCVDTEGFANTIPNYDPKQLPQFCTLAQLGRDSLILSTVPSPVLALFKDISIVNQEDNITWNAVSCSKTFPADIKSVVINLLSITPAHVFSPGLPIPSTPNPSGGDFVTAQVRKGSGSEIATYIIKFEIVITYNNGTPPETKGPYTIDPKIYVHA